MTLFKNCKRFRSPGVFNGPTLADSYQTPEIGLAEGVMKLAEGVTSKLWLWGKYSLEKWINTFVQKIYEKGATPLVGPATETV